VRGVPVGATYRIDAWPVLAGSTPAYLPRIRSVAETISILRLISGGRSVHFVQTKRMGSLTAQGSSLENCRPKGLGGSNPSPSAIWKRVREAYCAWLLTRCGKSPQVRILPLPSGICKRLAGTGGGWVNCERDPGPAGVGKRACAKCLRC